jgi:hypothetical protein
MEKVGIWIRDWQNGRAGFSGRDPGKIPAPNCRDSGRDSGFFKIFKIFLRNNKYQLKINQ